MSDYQYIVKKIKEWALTNYGIPERSINIFSLKRLDNGNWKAGCSFIINNDLKIFYILLDGSGDIISYSNKNSDYMGSAPTLILIAEIFSILVIIGISISILSFIFAGALSINNISYYSCRSIPVNSGIAIPMFTIIIFILIILAIFIAVDFYVLIRILKIRKYINSGDAASALLEDTVGLGIIAIIFN
ncbi:hypothetical protein [Picrophilus oshimae]|uniref:Hypothetical membrane associated protein n=1 Tax=Picrophilus torridus (strain ATCC 700027 / DSM 9790 / JCM 10055 / NBRC 100828 / KAW 2/3) TaxID=1122961 RepID=Q6L1C9_PICTO|nr:hypothetical protein [Picrophilus oshimae]AAT43223.1 hypothetical membrane associated protein [Picrophilus oshimae DSM 9789]